MKYTIFLVIVAWTLLCPVLGSSVSIVDCSSDDTNWLCEPGKTCICTISGTCTNGVLFVYKDDIRHMLCCPDIVDSVAEISCPYSCWTSCVDDNEPPICYKRISHGNAGCPGGSICCESILVECPSMTTSTTGVRKRPCPYECCIDMPEYEYKYCPPGLKCCNDHTCRDVCESPLKIKLSPLTAILVAIASFIPLVLFLLFMGVI